VLAQPDSRPPQGGNSLTLLPVQGARPAAPQASSLRNLAPSGPESSGRLRPAGPRSDLAESPEARSEPWPRPPSREARPPMFPLRPLILQRAAKTAAPEASASGTRSPRKPGSACRAIPHPLLPRRSGMPPSLPGRPLTPPAQTLAPAREALPRMPLPPQTARPAMRPSHRRRPGSTGFRGTAPARHPGPRVDGAGPTASLPPPPLSPPLPPGPVSARTVGPPRSHPPPLPPPYAILPGTEGPQSPRFTPAPPPSDTFRRRAPVPSPSTPDPASAAELQPHPPVRRTRPPSPVSPVSPRTPPWHGGGAAPPEGTPAGPCLKGPTGLGEADRGSGRPLTSYHGLDYVSF
jgi:hypothetical protein